MTACFVFVHCRAGVLPFGAVVANTIYGIQAQVPIVINTIVLRAATPEYVDLVCLLVAAQANVYISYRLCCT